MASQRGAVHIAPQVLTTVASMAALAVPGVARFGEHPPMRVGRLLRRVAASDGVLVVVDDNAASIDLYLVVERDVNMLATSRQVQAEVARAVQETVGMSVLAVNVHIEDVAVTASQSDEV